MAVIDSDYILDNAPCGFLSFTADGKICQINKTLLDWIKFPKENVISKLKFSDLLGRGGRMYFEMYVFPMLNMQGYLNEISLDLMTSDNIVISCLFNATVIRTDDNAIQLISASLFNISDRKKYEVEILKAKKQADEQKQRFEFLANTLPSVLWTTLADGTITFINDRFYETFNLELPNDNRTLIKDIVFPPHFFSTLKSWRLAIKEVRESQWQIRLKNIHGNYLWFFIRIIPCLDAMGNVYMWLGSCIDINDQKEKQELILNALESKLTDISNISAQKSLILKELSFSQAHLVRSPVSKIMALISLLNDQETDNEIQFIISLLSQSAEQLDNVVSDILNKSYAGQQH